MPGIKFGSQSYNSPGEQHFYIACVLNGRPVALRVDGVYSEADAIKKGLTKMNGKLFEVFTLSKRDDVAAQRAARTIFADTCSGGESFFSAGQAETKPKKKNIFRRAMGI